MNLLKKSALAIALSGAAMSASASQFYIDTAGTGIGVAGLFDAAVCATCTGLKTEANIAYESETVITLDGGSLVGDTIVTTGGLNIGGSLNAGNFGNNKIDGFNPGSFSGGFTADETLIGAGSGFWGLSFSMELHGTVAAASGLVISEVAYTHGTIEVFAIVDDTDGGADGSTFVDAINIFDLSVYGSSFDNPSNFEVFGAVSFSGNEDANFADFFNIAGTGCDGDATQNSFSELDNCVPAMEISWIIDQNLNDEAASLSADGLTASLTGNHNGSVSFNVVPEPASLLLLGAGLLGFAGRMRRKHV